MRWLWVFMLLTEWNMKSDTKNVWRYAGSKMRPNYNWAYHQDTDLRPIWTTKTCSSHSQKALLLQCVHLLVHLCSWMSLDTKTGQSLHANTFSFQLCSYLPSITTENMNIHDSTTDLPYYIILAIIFLLEQNFLTCLNPVFYVKWNETVFDQRSLSFSLHTPTFPQWHNKAVLQNRE